MPEQPKGRMRDAEATREAILAAAEALFARDGFAGARIDAIAAASGYNKSLIFQYFGDKLGLYRAVVARMKEQTDAQLAQLIAPFVANDEAALDAHQVRTLIEAAVTWTFDYYLARPNLVRILAWEAAEGWRTFNMLETQQGGGEWLVAVSSFTRRAQAAGLIHPDLDPIMMAITILGMILHFHSSVARYQRVFPRSNLTSAAALTHAREQMVALVAHGAMVHTS
jgi:TetR/AcrR family transcriptional regulator